MRMEFFYCWTEGTFASPSECGANNSDKICWSVRVRNRLKGEDVIIHSVKLDCDAEPVQDSSGSDEKQNAFEFYIDSVCYAFGLVCVVELFAVAPAHDHWQLRMPFLRYHRNNTLGLWNTGYKRALSRLLRAHVFACLASV
jgi:hypothetical protein